MYNYNLIEIKKKKLLRIEMTLIFSLDLVISYVRRNKYVKLYMTNCWE